MARRATTVFVALAAADTVLAAMGRNRARWLTKPLLMPALMAGSDRSSRRPLAFGAAGDVALLGSSDAAFTAGLVSFLAGHLAWIAALRWQRLPEMERLGDFLFTHVEGIAAYCDHRVRFGVVESINTTIKAVLRRARGMRDEAMLLLKLKWATARPIRSARDVARFLHPEGMHSLW